MCVLSRLVVILSPSTIYVYHYRIWHRQHVRKSVHWFGAHLGSVVYLIPSPHGWRSNIYIDLITPAITKIVNPSLSSAEVPTDFRYAIVLPLLKKICLDPEIFNNFRPISNLMFVSKLIEKVVASRLHSHMLQNDLYEQFQSSYRKLHGTETAPNLKFFC